jgi:hypothetical protein
VVIAGGSAPGVSILVLTEDSGKHAHDTIAALCKKMLQLVEPGCQTQRIAFEPAKENARRVVNANQWKSGKKHRDRVALVQTIATKIGEQNGFVFFHVDGDCVWSKRESSENFEKFESLIIRSVRALLLDRDVRRKPQVPPDVESQLARLRLIMPFYSVEAWLYQNIDVAIALCHAHHGGKDADRFARWREHRHELDELERPKDELCLQDRHNKELAERAYPAPAVYEAGRSFATAVESLRACDALCQALRAVASGA